MKKIYLLAILLLTISLTICKADSYQPGFVILKSGKRVSGQIKLYKNAPWKNQRFIWLKDSAALAANPNVSAKKIYASGMKFYQVGTRQFVKVTYVDQADLKLRNLYTNSWMLERVANGRFVAYMYYSYPPEFFDYFFADPKGDQTEPAGNDNAMIKYRIIFKKNNAKHFVNAYSYGLASYFQDTPQILQKYSTGAYGNQPDVDGSMFTRLSEICNRTIFTSRAETKGIIAAFNDYNQIYAPKIEAPEPTPTPAQSTADLFKPYLFKGTIIDNDTHKGVVGATVSYVDSASQQVVKQTLTSTTGSYEFNVLDRRPFGIKVEKNGFFTQNLTGEAASAGKLFADNSSSANSGSSNVGLTTGSSANGNGANGSANNGATTGAAATGSLAVTDGAITGIGATGNHLSARYMRYIHSSRYKHSIYYKLHLQHERELAKQKAASDAAAKSGLLAGSPATDSSASGNTTGGSATRSFAGGSSSGFAPSASNVSSSNGDSGNASANGPTSQELAKSGKIANGAFVSPAIRLQAYAVNKPIVINNILYDYGYATLRPESITVLDGLVKTMIDNPKVVIELSAHTDSVGSDAYNLKLSQDRAQSCVDYMISKGINATRISAVGYGKSRPIAPNSLPGGQDNPDGRQLNRRIEFVVKGNDKRMTDLTHR
ncbi:OmpA family protein [Mucilaginibacter sp. L196]|uniref:OmpA family protein n=1 Tax=Mucilaginibacter sp. L196 TaxID=1641870 RepID=UPI001C20BC98|nr:OmpA family protein [Mucilaginibacter sp. L196]